MMQTVLEPVELSRMRTLLKHGGLEFRSESASVKTADTHGAVFTWSVENPQVMQLSARWRGVAQTDEEFKELQRLVSECNSSCAYPKAYMVPLGGTGRYTVGAECNLLISRGLTEQQFLGFIERAASALCMFIHRVECCLPDLVTWEVPS